MHWSILQLLHVSIVAAYVVAPIVAVAIGLRVRRKGRAPFAAFMGTLLAGLLIGLGLCGVYAVICHGRIIATQVLLAGYFATALLVLLKGLDALFCAGLRWMMRLTTPPQKISFGYRLRLLAFGAIRLAALFTILLPYIMAAIMTYRPKVAPLDDPQSLFRVAYDRVSFRTVDGVQIVGWWIPAAHSRGASRWPQWGKNTVIVCPGLGSSKANQLPMCQRLLPGGFNVMIFDFRAHGESGGQLTTFGDLERRDVLAAVHWVRSNHSDQAQKIFGLGAKMGGAALIAAAADDSDDGRAIDAIATYAAFDDLNSLARSVANRSFAKPFNWLLYHLAFPLASAQVGVDLQHFSPAQLTDRIWPRPMLFIHGMRDEIIDFNLGQSLFSRAPQPKFNYWIENGWHNDILEDDDAAKIVLEFFKTAKVMRVI